MAATIVSTVSTDNFYSTTFNIPLDAISLHFDGQSLILMDLKKRPIESSYDDVFRFRFRTNSANGNILYSKGTQGDFMALQMVNNKLVYSLDLGGGGLIESISAGSLLDDNLWHDVLISRRGRDVLFTVDRVLVRHFLQSDYTRLNLNHDLFIGGIPIKISDPLNTRENFHRLYRESKFQFNEYCTRNTIR